MADMKLPVAFVVLVAARVSLAIADSPDSYKDAVLSDKPFAFYRLGEASNTQPVADEVGNNPGEYVNAPEVGTPGALASDHNNTAVSLVRERQQYIKLTELPGFGSGLTSGFSVEYWLKTKDSSDHQAIFGAANGPDYRTMILADIAYEGKGRRLRTYCRDSHWNRFEADFYPDEGNINIFDDQWHCIVHVYDPKAELLNERVRLYVDGIRQNLSGVFKGWDPKFSDFNNPLTLGAVNLRGAKVDYLEGSLADFAFYLSPLSEDQIGNHYRAAKMTVAKMTMAGPLAPWRSSSAGQLPPEVLPLAREAKEQFDRGDYLKAERIYRQILARAPNNPYALSNLGVTLLRAGKYKLAKESLKKAVEVAPEDAFVHCVLGIVYYEEAEDNDAINELTKSLAINPRSAMAHYYLSVTASRKGWKDAAEKELEKAQQLSSEYENLPP